MSDRTTDLDQMTTTFGARDVTATERGAEVNALFDRIAPRYDLMNDLMSFGLHRLWKRDAVRTAIAALKGRQGPLLDLAGGTGDLALAIKDSEPYQPVIVADASAGMLEQARVRGGDRLEYLHAKAESLPLEDDSVAAITLAFGLRNMTHPQQALQECARVLYPSASLLLLEFSKPASWFAPFYALHARWVIPALGAMVARDKGAYTYLVESIQRFPAKEDVTRSLEQAGFTVTSTKRFMFGVAVLHTAQVK